MLIIYKEYIFVNLCTFSIIAYIKPAAVQCVNAAGFIILGNALFYKLFGVHRINIGDSPQVRTSSKSLSRTMRIICILPWYELNIK